MKRFNVLAAKKYQKQDGSQGTKWVKLGTVMQKQDGSMFGELDCIPLGSWFDGSVQLYPVEQQSSNTQPQQQQNTYQAQQSQNQYGNYQG
jgi:hypothetical protein